ncbi:PspA/IM30 family protein [Corynebacterium sp. S7]
MANPFSKGWKYLMASFDQKIDENADPKVQIQQAVAAAKKQHQQITEQAASVIGNKKQLEMQMNRLQKSQEEHQQKARTALMAADKATAEGDTEKAQQFSNTAEIFASQLVAVEQELENTKNLYQQADQAAAQAQKQQKESEARLKSQLAEVDKLMAQADQAEMQQKTSEAMDSIGQFKSDDSVPTLDGVRDKIERRYADALGQQELLGNTVNDRMSEITSAGTDMKASAKLDEIRASMRTQEQITAGSGDAAGSGAASDKGSDKGSEHLSGIEDAEAYLAEDKSEGNSEQK